MPGVRTSQACYLCKQRKTRCDQNWPTCYTCKAARKVCSGPSSLLKFVDSGKRSRSDDSVSPDPAKNSPEGSLPPNGSRVMIRRGPLRPASDGGNASFGVFRLQAPRATPTTVSERVSSRLISLLKHGEDTGVAMQMSYLPHLPQRLSQSDCLRDCTALFCSAWSEYNRGKPVDQLLATKLYPKAIRSLQRAINGPHLYTVETLGAMIMFERIGTLFSNGEAHSFESHRRGIEHVMLGKGSLDAGDKLDLSLAFKSQWELTFLALSGVDNPVLRLLWESTVDEPDIMRLVVFVEELQCFDGEYAAINRSFSQLAPWIREFRAIQTDPNGMVERMASLVEELCTHETVLQSVIDRVVARATALGHMRELSDPNLHVGKSFDFASARLAQALAGIHAIRRMVLRLIFDLGALYGTPDAGAYRAYRGQCERNWMFLPYAASLDPISAGFLGRIVLPSLEAAQGDEFNQLADLLWTTDRFQCKYPRDREMLRAMVLSIAMKESGRS
ncbi:unnamed protein product [Clonostachys rhizophaga]|uniref:Zn(2)-C6 fungal-type domain-containing protein n=1 Tax=Clonostachys rhizophaga TaxID=160324 RepID=A0A9N9VNZ9_9HYPO|nr:unnamed protein product [Clonostachys rhizophaga]